MNSKQEVSDIDRNKVAGPYIGMNDLGRPLSSDETYKRLLKIIGPGVKMLLTLR